MYPLFSVMAGGAIGAGLRYLTGKVMTARVSSDWPWGTFTVNLLGGLAMGMLTALVLRSQASEGTRLLLGVGVLGGFTTFSAFSLEGFQMLQRGQMGLAIGYGAASVAGSIASLAAGYWMLKA
jgi:fluoride exporter